MFFFSGTFDLSSSHFHVISSSLASYTEMQSPCNCRFDKSICRLRSIFCTVCTYPPSAGQSLHRIRLQNSCNDFLLFFLSFARAMTLFTSVWTRRRFSSSYGLTWVIALLLTWPRGVCAWSTPHLVGCVANQLYRAVSSSSFTLFFLLMVVECLTVVEL